MPHPRHRAHGKIVGHLQTACALIRADGWIIRRIRRDFDDADPVGDFREIAQHCHRVSASGILRAKFGQSRRRIAAHNHLIKVEHTTTIRKTQHRAHLFNRGFASAVTDRLIQERRRITRRAFSGAGN